MSTKDKSNAIDSDIQLAKLAVKSAQANIDLFQAQLNLHQAVLNHLQSIKFISIHNIKRAEVQLPADPRRFHEIDHFIAWLRMSNCTKPWAEWNGLIYAVEDLKQNRMPHSVARLEHVPE